MHPTLRSRYRNFHVARCVNALIFLSTAPALAAAPQTPPLGVEGKAVDLCPHATAEYRRVLTEATLPAARETDAETDVLHYLLDIEIIPEYSFGSVSNVRVQGTSTIDVASLSPGLTQFTVDLHSSLTVSAVTGDIASWSRVGATVVMNLDHAYAVGEQFQVAITYSGYPAAAGFGAFNWWTHNGDLAVGTLSEPYYARNWWPCKDSLGDKATMQMQVTVPNGLVVASNGLDEGTIVLSGNRTKWLWHETYPMMPYLASLAITNFQRYDLLFPYDDGGGPQTMPVYCYLYPENWNFGTGLPAPAYKTACDELVTMLTTFSDAYGLYPFIAEKYGVADMSGGLDANMEHQTITSMVGIANNSPIMAHELAHHWWGDLVTCRTWYDIWLNEGFASYSEALYEEHKPGGGISSYWSRMNTRRPYSPNNQVYRTSISSIGAIFSGNDVYNKGAWVVHMLRGVMGDDAFLAALAHYRATRAFDSATTAEFAADISASFGADLSWFTDEWVMNPGSPRYEWNYATSNIGGQNWVKLRIVQTQTSQGYGVFTMPVRLRVTTPAGVETHKVWNDAQTGYYIFPVAAAPTGIDFDREDGVSNRNWILFQSATQVASAVSAPPVLLSADWTPFDGSAINSTLELQFSEDIGSFSASDFTLVGDSSGVQTAISVIYSPAAQTATLDFVALPFDTYTLTLASAGIVANGKSLDGEVAADTWYDLTLLPSGDGQPGGDTVLTLVRRLGDVDGDGDIDNADAATCIDCLTGPLQGPPGPGCDACDFDLDADVDLRDAADLFGAIGN
ncbi:MAG TPA: M1 family aminopeptidase [Phycisphaerae bacterium]|nr:M1 family aminopeptidase [Phycisphaerae bacterium]